MPVRSLVIGAEHPILRTVSSPVKAVDAKIKKLIKDLKDTVKEHKGLGLAAPQLGHNLRVVIVNLNHGTPNSLQIAMINPVITFFSDTKNVAEEGCLSLPGLYLNVERSTAITVTFLSPDGQSQTLSLKDLNARVVQHEVDHLDGVLIVDKGDQKVSRSEQK